MIFSLCVVHPSSPRGPTLWQQPRFETFGVPGETAVDELGQSINPSIRSAGRRSKSRLENQ